MNKFFFLVALLSANVAAADVCTNLDPFVGEPRALVRGGCEMSGGTWTHQGGAFFMCATDEEQAHLFKFRAGKVVFVDHFIQADVFEGAVASCTGALGRPSKVENGVEWVFGKRTYSVLKDPKKGTVHIFVGVTR